jgi:hypothetical protein
MDFSIKKRNHLIEKDHALNLQSTDISNSDLHPIILDTIENCLGY